MSRYNYSQGPNAPDSSIIAQVARLAERVSILERATRVASVEAPPPGEDTTGETQSSSSFTFYSATGTKIMEIGSTSGFGDRGMIVYRNDGSEAIRVARFSSAVADQVVQLKDRSGNAIFQDDYVAGNGLNWPKLPVTFYPVTTVFEASTTATAFTNLFRSRPRYQNPNMRVIIQAWTSGASVQAEIQLKDSFFGQYGQLVTHTAGTTQTEYIFLEQIVPFGSMGDERDMFITGRISSGAGTLTVRLISALGE